MNVLQIKAAVRERDGYACVDCGMSNEAHIRMHGGSLQVHRKNPGSRYTLEGCETLCLPCHMRKPKTPWGERLQGMLMSVGTDPMTVRVHSDPEWVRRSIEEANRLGLGLSAFIRMVVSQYLDRAESDRASQPKSRKS